MAREKIVGCGRETKGWRGECGESGIRGDGIGGEGEREREASRKRGAGRGAVVNLWTYFSRRAVAINPAL